MHNLSKGGDFLKKYSVAARAWIVTINNPENYGYSDCPCVLCEQLRAQWLAGRSERSGVWMFCVSNDGVPHVRMVLIDTVPFRERHIWEYVPADSSTPLATSHNIESAVKHFVRHILDTERVLVMVH